MIFAIAARDELWAAGRRLESRLSHGIARHERDEIFASDQPDDALVRACDDAMTAAREIAKEIDGRVRIVVRATESVGAAALGSATARPGAGAPTLETTFTVTLTGLSVVSTPEHVRDDVEMLRSLIGQQPTANRQLPIVWHNGSAAVLLHEACGHATEHGASIVEWPAWLRVDAPMAMRRESFTDVPLLRMMRVDVSQENAPFELPDERVDVRLIAGGAYDPLTDVVTIDVAVPRFTIRAMRADVARALRGASGAPIRYPGVICSREGQELHVPSAAPLMVTDPL